MKKIFILLLSMITTLTIAACTTNNNTNITNPNNNNTNQSQNNNQSQYSNINVTVTSKKNLPINYDENRYSNRVEFSFLIKNNSSKPIKGIKGVLTIKDLFGIKIIALNCDFTGKTINANQSTTFEGIGIDINQFMDNHLKLYNEDYSDMIYEYKITSVVYANDNIGSEATTESSKVKIEVLDKYNLPVNYDANRYSPRVEFNFKVSNLTAKPIKGIQGVLTIKDLFGVKIMALNCDFTGKTINANQFVSFNGIGFDINQFMDNHVKIYNEEFEDLIFEYTVNTIVCTDGTQE